ncbi:hypothetical protein H5410_019708 [Solanum commersonii]|uniref:Uncharacterized protein n=1 Tax=Solanum commersonii TaxID=4109 RepID=A0A9J5Z5Z9_SOLCO|nr:hypothetical protein H5410_019708 [Solanum commersonii]
MAELNVMIHGDLFPQGKRQSCSNINLKLAIYQNLETKHVWTQDPKPYYIIIIITKKDFIPKGSRLKKALVAWDKLSSPKFTGHQLLKPVGILLIRKINSGPILLGLFKNVDGCVSDTPKAVHFGESDKGEATILESPSNIALDYMGACFVYYIKGRQWDSISTPAQACWMLRKVLESRTILEQFHGSSNPAKPNARFTLWLQMHGREHLYVTCPFARDVLDRLPNWIHQQSLTGNTWEQFMTGVIQRAKGKSQQAQIFKMIYTEFVHGIWVERNMRIFEKQHRHWEAIARDIACICSVYNTEFSP